MIVRKCIVALSAFLGASLFFVATTSAQGRVDALRPRAGALRTDLAERMPAPVEVVLDVWPASGLERVELRDLRAAFVGLEPVRGISLRLGEYGRRREGPLASTAQRFSVGSFRADWQQPIGGSGLRLTAASSGTFSLWQAIAADGDDSKWTPCANQSDLFASLGLSYESTIFAHLFWRNEGDPFHLGGGEDCVGMGSLWSSRDAIGMGVLLRFQRFELGATLQRERTFMTHDHGHRQQEHHNSSSNAATLSLRTTGP